MKILEIGAGTGSATRVAQRSLGAETNSKRYAQYTFTDICSAFLVTARSQVASYTGLCFGTLDINSNPLDQGYATTFDLIIASQSLPTAKNIQASLQNIRRLLKP